MKKYSVILFAIVVVTFFGCQREQELENSVKTISSVSVSIDDETATKAIMDLQSGEITWNELGDRIGVFSDLHPDIVEYIWDRYEYDGQGRPIFRGEAMDGSHFFAVYPFTDSDEPDLAFNASETFRKDPNNSSVVRFVLDPANLNRGSSTYTGPVELKIPMVAKSDDANFVFKQTVSIFHFKIKGEGELPWVILTGNQHEALRGEGFIDMSEDVPVFRLDESMIEPYDPMARINNQQIGDSYSSSVSIDIDHYVLNGDDEIDVLYALPPMTFNKGISLALQYNLDEPVYEDGVSRSYDNVTKITTKSIAARRGKIKHFTIVDREIVETEREEGAEEEKDALMAIYNAMGGSSWKHVDNWGTDAPLKDWYGVEVDRFTGRVLRLYLGDNNLSGTIPEELGDLFFLETLDISDNSIVDVSSELQPLINLRGLDISGNLWQHFPSVLLRGGLISTLSVSFASEESIPDDFWELEGLEGLSLNFCNEMSIPSRIVDFEHLTHLEISDFIGGIPLGLFSDILYSLRIYSDNWDGILPKEIGNCTNLYQLYIDGSWTKPLPGEIGQCDSLRWLSINGPLPGPLPDGLFDCEKLFSIEITNAELYSPLPSSVSLAHNLRTLNIRESHLTGNLPVELTQTEIRDVNLRYNDLSGMVPSQFSSWDTWGCCWASIAEGNANLDYSEALPYIWNFEAEDINGQIIHSSSVSNNTLTALFQYVGGTGIKYLKEVYEQYKNQGFEVWSTGAMSEEELQPFLNKYGFPMKNMKRNSITHWGFQDFGYPHASTSPVVTLFDSTGKMVFYCGEGCGPYLGTYYNMWDLPRFVSNYYGDTYTPYESTDYTKNRTVVKLQDATGEGGHISVVLLGDGFTDNLIDDGTYEDAMRQMMEALFCVEPYNYYRDYFDVYYVIAVSQNSAINDAAQKTVFGSHLDGGSIDINDSIVIDYVREAVSHPLSLQDVLVCVVSNMDAYAGTCIMNTPNVENDYGSGLGIACLGAMSDEKDREITFVHEVGHGFAKLTDEYCNKIGFIPAGVMSRCIEEMTKYGWYKNGDFVDDPQHVKWAQFITDERYASEKIGVFQGAFTYPKGAYSPTADSVMGFNYQDDVYFNAPSRYAIWYRINKLIHGAEWAGSYNDFVAFDQEHHYGRVTPRLAESPSASPNSSKRVNNFVCKTRLVSNEDWR